MVYGGLKARKVGVVRIQVMTLMSLSKILYDSCFSSHRGINGLPVKVEVDIVHEKALERYGCPGCKLPRELRKIKGMFLAQ